ncbi:MAG: D-alanyl-D-alanine carboxypeptidase [Clostridiales bacterium]|nr:D-alanyl-D-alanine carboxypeptidase [Clostridiales bacterium]
MKKTIAIGLIFCMLCTLLVVPSNAVEFTGEINAKSAILMEQSSGKVLFEYNADEALPPASVTKVMTILLVLEAIDEGKITINDPVTVSAYATSMGGSQIYLKENEVMSVSDLLKAVVVASANDAAVALAEHLYGTEEAFVARMNERAAELGMVNTNFCNTNGLDDTDTGHLTSARDIAIMSREVLKHPLIFDYSTIWMDSVRNGEFGLTNTNRLIRFYHGANGLKTGSTSKAGFCISATAERDGMQLIAVIMGAPSRDTRNALAASLLDFGFANYSVRSFPGQAVDPVPVKGGTTRSCEASYADASFVTEKSNEETTTQVVYNTSLRAPVKKGDVVGTVRFLLGSEELGTTDLVAQSDVKQMTFGEILLHLLRTSCFCS